ncbi:MAG: response regulator transcription factor [Syntrophobacterales bacterium]|jgi:DNA-binding NarL/FixJ family response regulator|nr:response regulator transcription factor [Syntrophobacterales bacterium]
MEPRKPSTVKTPIRIILADDHQIVRQGLRMLLEAEPDMVVIAEACNGREVLKQAQELLPDLIIMDVTMPELNGIEATRQILSIAPGIKVIALSMNSDSRFVLNMFRSGVSGYLLKECSQGELVKAIRTVIKEKTYLGPGISDIVIKDFLTGWQTTSDSAFSTLTPKEREVLQLLAEGKSTKQIAESLYISIKTVESHRKQLMDKLEIRSVAELTKYAIREGLTSG